MKTFRHLILPGFVIWLVPFVISFFFYNSSRELIINYDLFKSIMIVVSSGIGAVAIVRYNKTISDHYKEKNLVAGIVWLAINLALDLVILIPMSGMDYSQYFMSIGLRYLQIPLFTYATGVALHYRSLQLN